MPPPARAQVTDVMCMSFCHHEEGVSPTRDMLHCSAFPLVSGSLNDSTALTRNPIAHNTNAPANPRVCPTYPIMNGDNELSARAPLYVNPNALALNAVG